MRFFQFPQRTGCALLRVPLLRAWTSAMVHHRWGHAGRSRRLGEECWERREEVLAAPRGRAAHPPGHATLPPPGQSPHVPLPSPAHFATHFLGPSTGAQPGGPTYRTSARGEARGEEPGTRALSAPGRPPGPNQINLATHQMFECGSVGRQVTGDGGE
jgi:hypothetical protein